MPVPILGFWQLRGRNLFSRLVWTATTTAAFTWRSPWIQQQPPSRSYYQNTMSSFATQRNSGTITVSPKNEEDQSALVVISHGLGDTAEGFADVAEVCELWRGVSFFYIFGISFLYKIPNTNRNMQVVTFVSYPLVLTCAMSLSLLSYIRCCEPAQKELCQTNALYEVYFTHGTDTTSHDEYGYGNAIMV
jgi:hypothetical protein